MIYVDLSSGDGFGWGICGDNLASALAALVPVERLGKVIAAPRRIDGVLLQKIADARLAPRHPNVTATRHVGYAFFEEDLFTRQFASYANTVYDVIATGSRWCESVLRSAGCSSVVTVHQGIDRVRFHPDPDDCSFREDTFVVFSGGKIELRKGQDIVARAFKVLAERHHDVVLVAAWHNAWPAFVETMAASPHMPWSASGETFEDSVRSWLFAGGIDVDKVQVLPALPNAMLGSLYRRSDVGIFPSRCEGGTNLVLMEYMACGRCAIATEFSGHRDVVTDTNSVPLRNWKLMPLIRERELVACWCEPDLEEVVEALEQAYRNRCALRSLGRQAAIDMSEWTWERAARRFLEILVP